jgi:siroheme synthase-like protein
MAFGYPVLLELAGRRAVVVGAFAVEAGKVEGLLVAGAEVTLIAKGPEQALARLERDPRVTVHRRDYRGPEDLAGAVLCVASAPEPGVRDTIAADARAAGVLVNVMDDVPNCDFAAPAIVRRGDLVIAIGTGGRAPALASRLRADLAARYGPEWTELIEVVGRVRTATLPHLPDFEDRSRRWRAALDLDELERLIRAGQPDEAATRLHDRLLAGLRQADLRGPADLRGTDLRGTDLPGAEDPRGEDLRGMDLPGACGQSGAPIPASGYPPVQGPHNPAASGEARLGLTPGDGARPGTAPGDRNRPGPTPRNGNRPGPTPGSGNRPGPTPGSGNRPEPTPGNRDRPGPTPGSGNRPGTAPGNRDRPEPTPGHGNRPARAGGGA